MKTLELNQFPLDIKTRMAPAPTVVGEIMNLASDPRTSVARLSSILLKDPSLTKGILRKANSPYYGFFNRINSLDFAIVLLGFDVLKETVSSLLVNNALRKIVNILFEYEETWSHSLACGLIAGYVAENSKQCDSNDAFIAGLLHDIGYVILHQYLNEDPEAIRYTKNGRLRTSVEAASGVSHNEAGFWIATRWQLPPRIAEAIQCHHAPRAATIDPALTAVVHAADVLCSHLQIGRFSHDGTLSYDQAAIELIKFDEASLDRDQLERYCKQMRSDIDGGQSLDDIVNEIKERFVDAMGNLAEKERVVLALYYYENISFLEIGRVLKLDEPAVAELHDRAVTTLKNVLWNIQPQRAAL
ncbi:MAG TPA: HDOD domain-containing protein [Bacteroidota bacterium]|nr:HDOD domain-containing protein [Bacteroidota bacterium]